MCIFLMKGLNNVWRPNKKKLKAIVSEKFKWVYLARNMQNIQHWKHISAKKILKFTIIQRRVYGELTSFWFYTCFLILITLLQGYF